MSRHDLFLHEELMLLALRDKKGTIHGGTMYSFAVGGAVLAELLLADRIGVSEEGKKARVELLDSKLMGDPLLDEWLAEIGGRKKPRTLQDWVSRVAHTKNLKHRIAAGLSHRGILRTTEDKVLWIFTRKIYPELDPGPERELMARLESAIFEDDDDVDPSTAVLISLAHHGAILKSVFDKARLEERKERLEQIASGELTAQATKEAIEAMRAAVMIATIVPAVVTTTVVTS